MVYEGGMTTFMMARSHVRDQWNMKIYFGIRNYFLFVDVEKVHPEEM